MNNKKLCAVHPGMVRSMTDGDQHYITYSKLIHLYGLDPKDCILWDPDLPETTHGRKWEDYEHFFPSDSGNYEDHTKSN